MSIWKFFALDLSKSNDKILSKLNKHQLINNVVKKVAIIYLLNWIALMFKF